MRDAVTTILDIVGLMAVAVGMGWWIWVEVAPPAGLVAGGVLVGLVSAVAAAQDERREKAADAHPARDGSA